MGRNTKKPQRPPAQLIFATRGSTHSPRIGLPEAGLATGGRAGGGGVVCYRSSLIKGSLQGSRSVTDLWLCKRS